MNAIRITTLTAVLVLAASLAEANITPTTPSTDGVNSTGSDWDPMQMEFSVIGSQEGQSGRITGALLSDTEVDPTVTLRTTLDNDTGFTWTGYRVKVSMDKPFTLDSALVRYPATSEAGWWGTVDISPAILNGGVYVGEVDYWGGTPIPAGGTLDFSYKMTFIGTVHYCQELIPVPEPATAVLAVAGVGGLLLAAWRRRHRVAT
jgi:hypothetical protein